MRKHLSALAILVLSPVAAWADLLPPRPEPPPPPGLDTSLVVLGLAAAFGLGLWVWRSR